MLLAFSVFSRAVWDNRDKSMSKSKDNRLEGDFQFMA